METRTAGEGQPKLNSVYNRKTKTFLIILQAANNQVKIVKILCN